MTTNSPWFINAMDRMEEEFFCQFMDDLNEFMFVQMTEAYGQQNRTLHEAAEAVNSALHGRPVDRIMDEEYEDLPYDQFFMENSELVQQIMKRMLREAAERW